MIAQCPAQEDISAINHISGNGNVDNEEDILLMHGDKSGTGSSSAAFHA